MQIRSLIRVLDLVKNPEDRFSHNEAHIEKVKKGLRNDQESIK